MKVVILAKTRMGGGACIGGITFEGRSVRLIAADQETNEHFNLEYAVGDVWDVDYKEPPELVPPHVENIIVTAKRKLPPLDDLASFVERQMPPQEGDLSAVFEGKTGATSAGSLYICERLGLPNASTMFWRPDRSLQLDDDGKRIRYRYPEGNDGRTLTFVGFQDPLPEIPAGTLLRVSLAHWWRPLDLPEGELRCYVQLSGWVLPTESDEPFDDWFEPQESYEGPLFTAPAGEPAPAFVPPKGELPEVLEQLFGLHEFRPLQREIIDHLLSGRDSLVIMPTGGGKSLCYQLPALLFEGLTVVVSPLISLMQDQVAQLRELGLPAVFLNSSQSYSEQVHTMARIRRGEIKLLYLAPETLLRPESLLMLDKANVSCLAVDEAHCISQWGHDFRPEYRQLVRVRRRFPQAVCIALTATATPRVQGDIQERLSFTRDQTFISSFDRPNLFIEVIPKQTVAQQCLEFIAEHRDQPGIIYCLTTKQVDELSAELAAYGIKALPYHGKMETVDRARNQTAFVNDDVQVIVATIAFGMGIDKSNVRWILHAGLPKNMEHYYQQIGRAGRDGLRADCRLLFGYGDVDTARYFIDQGAPRERAGRLTRLEALLQWAQSNVCRRIQLLDYFGETYQAENCGMCDNCLRREEDLEDLTEPAQKFLSCVYRTKQMFGMAHIISVLRGSGAAKIRKWGHDKVSTYGIGRDYSAKTWKSLGQQMIDKGLLDRKEKGQLVLTAEGWRVLRGEEAFRGTLIVTSPRATLAAGAAPENQELFELLRARRKELADERGVPPYVVFSDQTLLQMASFLPHSRDAFLAISGVGPHKLEQYGDLFLPLIRQFCAANGLKEQPYVQSTRTVRSSSGTVKARTRAIAEAFASGASVHELQLQYGVKRNTIIKHLENFVRAGGVLPSDRLRNDSGLTADEQAQVMTAFDELGTERLRPVYDRLEGDIPWDKIRLMSIVHELQSKVQSDG